MRGLLAAACLVAAVGCGQGADWKAKRDAAEADATYAAYKAREAEQGAKRQAEAGALEERAHAKALEREREEREWKEPERARLEALTAESAAMTPAERAAKVRALCSPQKCQREDARAVAASAKTPAERTALERPIEAAREAAEGKARELAADQYEDLLLKQRMNPDSVRAAGAGKKTLVIRGWFCSRQHLYDLDRSEAVKGLRVAGFNRIECSNGLETWSGDL